MGNPIVKYSPEHPRQPLTGGYYLKEWQLRDRLGYIPEFWERPSRVGRYYNAIQSLPPGQSPPSWMDVDGITQAYEYMRWRNGNNNWWEWKYLNPADQGREFLRGIEQPPNEMLWNDERIYRRQEGEAGAPGRDWGEPTQPQPGLGLMQLNEEDWSKLPAWQQVMWSIMYNPYYQGVATMAPWSILGGVSGAVAGGPLGAIVGAATPAIAGAALSFAADPHTYEMIAEAGRPGLASGLQYIANTALAWLNMPAEWLEKGVGTVGQVAGAALVPYGAGPEERIGSLDEVLKNLPAVWKASAITYEAVGAKFTGVANIPAGVEWLADMIGKGETDVRFAHAGEVHVLGQAEPVRVDADVLAILNLARNEIIRGTPPEQVVEEMRAQFGFSGTFTDLIFQMGADPLNVVPKFERSIVGKYAQLTNNPALEMAAKMAVGEGFIGTRRVYGNLLRSGYGPGIGDMTVRQLKIAGLTPEGIIQELKPGVPIKGIGKTVSTISEQPLNPVHWFEQMKTLTPDSRFRALVGLSHENIKTLFDGAGGDFPAMIEQVKQWIDLPPSEAAEVARILGLPEAATVRQALADFKDTLKNIEASWVMGEARRNMLLKIADAIGEVPAKALEMLRGGEAEQVHARFIEVAGSRGDQGRAIVSDPTFTPAALKGLVDYFKDNPWHPDLARGYLHNAMLEHIGKWAVQAYNVKPSAKLERFFSGMKSIQSLLLLGFNPAYFANNMINNTVNRVAMNVFGFVGRQDIEKFFDDFGIRPYRLRAGTGAGDVGDDVDVRNNIELEGIAKADNILRAAQREGDWIQSFQDVAQKVSRYGPISNLARANERYESSVAMYYGVKQAWSRLWNRRGVIPKLSHQLKMALSAIDPRLPDALAVAIERGMKIEDIDGLFKTLSIERSVDQYLPQLADNLGLDVADLRETLTVTGVYDAINTRLAQGATISDAFAEADRWVRDYLDTRLRDDIVTRVTEAQAQVEAEGFIAAIDIFKDIQIKLEEMWTRHFAEWQRAYELAYADGVDYGTRRGIIAERAAQADAEWRAHKAWEQATWLGVMKGLGFTDGRFPNGISPLANDFITTVIDLHNMWDNFHETRGEIWRNFFRGDYPSKEARSTAYYNVLEQLSEMYSDASVRENQFYLDISSRFLELWTTQFGGNKAAGAAQWWNAVTNLAQTRQQLMSDYRKWLRDRPISELANPDVIDFVTRQSTLLEMGGRKGMTWNVFLRELYMPLIGEIVRAGLDNAYQMVRDVQGDTPPPAPGEGPPPGTPPPGTPPEAGGIPIRAGEAQGLTPVETEHLRAIGLTQEELGILAPEVARQIIQAEGLKQGDLVDYPGAADRAIVIDVEGEWVTVHDNEGKGQTREINLRFIRRVSGTRPDLNRYSVTEAPTDVDTPTALDWLGWEGIDIFGPRDEIEAAHESRLPKVIRDRVSSDIYAEAKMMYDELPSGDESVIIMPDNTRMSQNPTWYREWYAEWKQRGKSLSKSTVENALKRIMEDEGKDAISSREETIRIVKEILFDRLGGADREEWFPELDLLYETQDIQKLIDAGRWDDATDAFRKWFTSQFTEDITEDEWINLTGSLDNFSELVDRMMEQDQAAVPGPEESITTPEIADAIENFKDAEEAAGTLREWEQDINELIQPEEAVPDRRILDELRAEIDRLKAENEQLRQDPLTDLPVYIMNRDQVDAAPVKLAIDVTGLKWLNDTFGEDSGNALLRGFADVSAGLGYDIYRVVMGGDEFVATFKNESEARAAAQHIQEQFAEAIIVVEDGAGNVHFYKGFNIYTGIGDSYKTAYDGVNESKRAYKEQYPELARGEKPPTVDEIIEVAEGEPDISGGIAREPEVQPAESIPGDQALAPLEGEAYEERNDAWRYIASHPEWKIEPTEEAIEDMLFDLVPWETYANYVLEHADEINFPEGAQVWVRRVLNEKPPTGSDLSEAGLRYWREWASGRGWGPGPDDFPKRGVEFWTEPVGRKLTLEQRAQRRATRINNKIKADFPLFTDTEAGKKMLTTVEAEMESLRKLDEASEKYFQKLADLDEEMARRGAIFREQVKLIVGDRIEQLDEYRNRMLPKQPAYSADFWRSLLNTLLGNPENRPTVASPEVMKLARGEEAPTAVTPKPAREPAVKVDGIELFQGEQIAVRQRVKRDGSFDYELYRPVDKNAVVDAFTDLMYANRVAQYIEDHGGSYEAAQRKAAKAFADAQQQKERTGADAVFPKAEAGEKKAGSINQQETRHRILIGLVKEAIKIRDNIRAGKRAQDPKRVARLLSDKYPGIDADVIVKTLQRGMVTMGSEMQVYESMREVFEAQLGSTEAKLPISEPEIVWGLDRATLKPGDVIVRRDGTEAVIAKIGDIGGVYVNDVIGAENVSPYLNFISDLGDWRITGENRATFDETFKLYEWNDPQSRKRGLMDLFRYDAVQANGEMVLLDAVASTWAQRNDSTPAEFWRDLRGMVRGMPPGKEAPSDAYAAYVAFERGQRVLAAIKNTDPTVFIHEIGHYFFDYALSVEDKITIMKWADVPNLDSVENITQVQEKFAEGYLRYRLEGKAPLSGLKRIFLIFRDFIYQILQGLNDKLGVGTEHWVGPEYDQEIRAVYDRLFVPDVWEMTKYEFSHMEPGDIRLAQYAEEWGTRLMDEKSLARDHRSVVYQALLDGKSVPDRVLAEYPDMLDVVRQRLAEQDAIPLEQAAAFGDEPPRYTEKLQEFIDRINKLKPGARKEQEAQILPSQLEFLYDLIPEGPISQGQPTRYRLERMIRDFMNQQNLYIFARDATGAKKYSPERLESMRARLVKLINGIYDYVNEQAFIKPETPGADIVPPPDVKLSDRVLVDGFEGSVGVVDEISKHGIKVRFISGPDAGTTFVVSENRIRPKPESPFFDIAQREVNAKEDFIRDIMEQFGKTREEADMIFDVYQTEGAIRLERGIGRWNVRHGAYWERPAIDRALQMGRGRAGMIMTREEMHSLGMTDLEIREYYDKHGIGGVEPEGTEVPVIRTLRELEQLGMTDEEIAAELGEGPAERAITPAGEEAPEIDERIRRLLELGLPDDELAQENDLIDRVDDLVGLGISDQEIADTIGVPLDVVQLVTRKYTEAQPSIPEAPEPPVEPRPQPTKPAIAAPAEQREAGFLNATVSRIQSKGYFANSQEFETWAREYGFDLANEYQLNMAYDLLEGAFNLLAREKRAELGPDAPLIRRILEMTLIENNIAKARRTIGKLELQQFSTPLPISEAAAWAADVRPGDIILEPTAGTGNLVDMFVGREDLTVITNEIDPGRVEVLRLLGHEPTETDILSRDWVIDRDGKLLPKAANVVIANPPWGAYSKGIYGKPVNEPVKLNDWSQRFTHLVMHRLTDEGRFVGVMPANWVYTKSRKTGEYSYVDSAYLKYLDSHYYLRAIIESPPDAYKTRATGVSSLLVVVDTYVPPLEALKKPVIRAFGEDAPTNWREYSELVESLGGEKGFRKREGSVERGQEIAAKARQTPAREPARPKTGPDATGLRDPAATRGDATGDPRDIGKYTPPAEQRPRVMGERPIEGDLRGTAGPGGDIAGERRITPEPGVMGKPGETADVGEIGEPIRTESEQPEVIDTRMVEGQERTVRRADELQAPEYTLEFTQRLADSKASISKSGSFTEYVARSPLRSTDHSHPHPTAVVETRSLAGVGYPDLLEAHRPHERVMEAVRRRAISTEGNLDPVWATKQQNEAHGAAMLIADDVGLGKSRTAAAYVLDQIYNGKKRILVITKDDQNVENLMYREFPGVAGGTADEYGNFTNIPDDYPAKRIHINGATYPDVKKEGASLPTFDEPAVYFINKYQFTDFYEALMDLRFDTVVVDEVHFFKNPGTQIGAAWYEIHKKDWMPRNVNMMYLSATPGTDISELQYLYGLRLWTMDGFEDWVKIITGEKSAEQVAKEQDARAGVMDYVSRMQVAREEIVERPLEHNVRVGYSWNVPTKGIQIGAELFVYRDKSDKKYKIWHMPNDNLVTSFTNETQAVVFAGILDDLADKTDWRTARKIMDERFPQASKEDMQTLGAKDASDIMNKAEKAKWGMPGLSAYEFTLPPAHTEQIMRELKVGGSYMSRDITRTGVVFDVKEMPFSQNEIVLMQRRIDLYRKIYEAWRTFGAMNEGPKKSAALFGINGDIQGDAKRALFAFRLPAIIEEAKAAIARGEKVVISTVSVSATDPERGFLNNAIGKINTQEVKKIKSGRQTEYSDPSEIPEALIAIAEIREELAALGELPSPIDVLLDEFGDDFGYITGEVSAAQRAQYAEQFQNDRLPVILISGAGKTGINLHDITGTKGSVGPDGQRHAVHLIVGDFEWSSTTFKQELGRVDRTGQRTSPYITVYHSGSAGEKKFVSTIANRMQGLGALSKGAGESTGTTALTEEFELGSIIDKLALEEMWRQLDEYQKELFIDPWFEDKTVKVEKGAPRVMASNIRGTAEGIKKFLLGLLSVPYEEANKIYDKYMDVREEFSTNEAVEKDQAAKTAKLQGEIVRETDFPETSLRLTEVKNQANQTFGIVHGILTPHMNKLKNVMVGKIDPYALEYYMSGAKGQGQAWSRWVTFFDPDKNRIISGLKIPKGKIKELAFRFSVALGGMFKPETAMADLRAGEKIPIHGANNVPWELYIGQGGEREGKIVIKGAKIGDREAIMNNGGQYSAIGSFFHIPEESLPNFFKRFPIDNDTDIRRPTDLYRLGPDGPEPTEEAASYSQRRVPDDVSVMRFRRPFEIADLTVVGMAFQDGKFLAWIPERFAVGREFEYAGGRGRLVGMDGAGNWVFLDDAGEVRTQPMEVDDPMVAGPLAPGTLDATAGVTYDSQIMEDGHANVVRPALDELQRMMIEDKAPLAGDFGEKLQGLDATGQSELKRYLYDVKQEMSKAKLASIRYGESKRDQALLNYSRRYGFDNILNMVFPYQFWYTRSLFNWALRVLDRPGFLSWWAKLKKFSDQNQEKGFPTRLKDKIRIPAPFLPEWAGGGMWVDPIGKLFPFAEFLRPIDRIMQDQNRVSRSAEYELIRMAQDGEITNDEAQMALTMKAGRHWDIALTRAKKQEDNDPLGYMEMFVSPALWLTMPYRMLQGKTDKTNPLPMSRSLRALSTATGIDALQLLDVESRVRKNKGLSEFGEWGNYYIDRQLANMAADGLITADQALMAMMDRSGDAYQEAVRRVSLEQAITVPGTAPLLAARQAIEGKAGLSDVAGALLFGWLPAGLLPDGELRQRGLKEIYDQAREKYNNGDEKAINQFFDDYPEYQARLALNDDPENRLRQFLKSHIWERWFEMPALHRKEAQKMLGPIFQEQFLNTETRDYESIDTETLAMWAREIGAMVPESAPESGKIGVRYPDELTTQAYEGYQAIADKYPGIYNIQNVYYMLAESERKAYLKQHPELVQYWDERRAYREMYPEISEYVQTSQGSTQNRATTARYSGSSSRRSNFVYIPIDDIDPALIRRLQLYYSGQKSFNKGMRMELRRLWKKYGKVGDFTTFVESTIRTNIMNQMAGATQ